MSYDQSEALPMSDLSDIAATTGLVKIDRDNECFFSFQQCAKVLFSKIPIGTVKRWLYQLGRRQSKTTATERYYLAQNGVKSCRFLISRTDLIAIFNHGVKKGREVSLSHENTSSVRSEMVVGDSNTSSSSSSTTTTTTTTTNTNTTTTKEYVSSNEHCSVESVSSMNDGNVTELASGDDAISFGVGDCEHFATSPVLFNACDEDDASELLAAGGGPVPSVDSSDHMPMSNSDSVEADTTREHLSEQDDSVPSGSEMVGRSDKIGQLPEHALNETLKGAISDLDRFYSQIVQPLRRGRHFTVSTLQKFLERVSCFLNYYRVHYPEKSLNFNIVDDFEYVEEYVNHLQHERKLCISTVVRTISALINLSRFVHRKDANVDACPDLIRLLNIQRQLLREENSYRLACQAGLSGNSKKTLLYSDVLETLRKLREKLDCCDGEEDPRVVHDFVLIALYVTCMCGRGKELRTLDIFDESKSTKQFVFNYKTRCNVLVFSADGVFTLYENDFKTLSSYGPSRMVLEEPEWLLRYLKNYLVLRNSLLKDNSHARLFFGLNGRPFTSPSLCLYLGRLFEREVNIRAGTRKLRHALVTYVLSLDRSDSVQLRESLASLMRHSLKQQACTYNDASRQVKTALSRELLNKSVEEVAFAPRKRQKADRTCRAEVGDICAVLDTCSTSPENARISLGRVLRISKDGAEALLMGFRVVEESEASYRASVECSSWEKVDQLIFPLDVVYESGENIYKLRSSPAEIYRAVHCS